MQYRALGATGLKVSTLSFGASSLGGVFRQIDESDGVRTVHVAVDHGINFIDVSPYYGATKAETVLGRALGEIRRERFYLATKVGQYGEGDFDFSAARAVRSVDESLQRLHVDHIDLIQCHDIEFVKLDQIVNETLPALHKLKETGKVRHVGITGLPLKIFAAVIDRVGPGVVETILSFCHYALNDSSLQTLIPYLRERQIGIINAAPTSMGLLTEQGPPAWHPASATIKNGCRRAVEWCLAQGINPVGLAVQFSIANPDVTTTLVGTASSKEMLDNIRFAETPMDQDKLAHVLDILRPIHNHNFTRGLAENQDPAIS